METPVTTFSCARCHLPGGAIGCNPHVVFKRRPGRHRDWAADMMYPLVNIRKAIENGYWNSGFSHEKWWFSIAMLNYQRVFLINKHSWKQDHKGHTKHQQCSVRVHIPFDIGLSTRKNSNSEATVLYSLPLKQAMRSDFLFKTSLHLNAVHPTTQFMSYHTHVFLNQTV